MIENKSMLKPRLDSVQAASLAPEKSDATVVMDHSEAWQRVCRRLRAEVGEDVFNSWFGRLELDEVHDDVARLSVPTKFLKSWIQSHYTDRIISVMASELPPKDSSLTLPDPRTPLASVSVAARFST